MRRNSGRRTHKTSNLLISAVISVMVIVIGVVIYSKSEELNAQNLKRDAEMEQLKAELSEEQKREEELKEYSKYVNTKQFVEDVARDKLGLIYPGELIFKGE